MPEGPLCMVMDQSCAAEAEPFPFNLRLTNATEMAAWRTSWSKRWKRGNTSGRDGIYVCIALVLAYIVMPVALQAQLE